MTILCFQKYNLNFRFPKPSIDLFNNCITFANSKNVHIKTDFDSNTFHKLFLSGEIIFIPHRVKECIVFKRINRRFTIHIECYVRNSGIFSFSLALIYDSSLH